MNHLGRPIYPFRLDWSQARNKSYTFDLADVQVGFGKPVFTTLQTNVVQGFSFTVLLPTPADILAHDAFFDALTGNLTGFWLPAPLAALRLVAVTSASVFEVEGQSLAQVWDSRPDLHLWFVPRTGEPMAGKLQSVTDLGNGRERITLTASLPATPTLQTDVFRLHYVRLADDKESGRYLAEGVREQPVKVVELPAEYTACETGEQLVYLYRFTAAAPVLCEWTFTSFAADVTSQGTTYRAWPMNHESLTKSVKPDRTGTNLVVAVDLALFPLTAHPLNLYFPQPPARPMQLQIFEAALAALDTPHLVFSGQVRSVKDGGKSLSATCDSWAAILKRKTPRMMIQPNCNYTIFDTDMPFTAATLDGRAIRARVTCCGLERMDYQVLLKIHSISGNDVECTLFIPEALQAANWKQPNWFSAGYLEAGTGLNFETRTVAASVWSAAHERLTLNLDFPLRKAAVGDILIATPGCDGEAATCRAFGNFNNFGGFIAIPARNLALQAIDLSAAQGGKK